MDIASSRNMVAKWGPPCDEFDPGCPCCQAWKLFGERGIEPTDEEVFDAVEPHTKETS